MPEERYLYEYAVIRVVPRVEREEFINVGIILFSKRKKFLRAKYMLHEAKLKMLFPEIDIGVIRENLRVYDQVCSGSRDGGPIAGLDIPERFRWLTAVRSTVIQTSRPHPGLLTDPEVTFERLFEEFVE
ncbi:MULTISPECIES: DUF3037 domain-containing protein [Odoribacteraceae]|uniref:DUF3037 domain-containing protein n=1 Tax=Odoribacteraceae TaxID=1853231 RepID=UPI000E4851DD|nr:MULTISPECIES: DUF3037 domain-containing protein [Odoribacteraceae]MCQ4874163.1 DUF3037 domain-containing protein [Butyricimonas paravirosa]RHR82774.1 DUF3037 domain-containing protein [Odoribacter sp. AF15-53]